jgi:Fic family protein
MMYLSAYFEQHREEYYGLLLAVSQNGAWEQWIRFFLKAVAVQSRDAIQRIDLLLALRQKYRSQLQKARASALLPQIVDNLFDFPAVTNPTLSKHMKVTPRSAQLNIEKLVESRILREATGQQRNRVYVATEIVSIVEQ